jgi:uncharacterized protein (DUF58 family)
MIGSQALGSLESERRKARRRRGRTVGSHLPRWLRPPRTLRPTRAGWVFFGLTLGVGFGALNSGNNLLYLVFSLMLAFLVLSGVLSESALGNIEVRRRLPRELFAGAPATLAVEITNTSRRVPAFAIAVEDLLQPREGVDSYLPLGRMFVLRVAPGATELRAYRLVPSHRGTLRLAGFRISTRFPFGLFAKASILEQADEALVYPGLGHADELHALRLGEGEGRSAQPATGSEVVGLRPFVPGDSLRRVHWRATLRRGTPVVRQSEEPRATEAAVYLATCGPSKGDRFERSVRRAATQVVRLLESGARVSLRTDETWIPPDHGPQQRARLLAFLARVAPRVEAS